MKRFFLLTLLATVAIPIVAFAQPAPTKVALFPFKNLYWEVKYDSLAWTYADSLYSYLTTRPDAASKYEIIPMDDLRDQMLALNIDPRSPSYETDIFKVVTALGARKVIWGTYLVKYEKANIEVIVIDAKTLMKDPVNKAEKLRPLYVEALKTVTQVGDKILPGLP